MSTMRKERTKNFKKFFTTIIPIPDSEFTKPLSVISYDIKADQSIRYENVMEMTTIGEWLKLIINNFITDDINPP